MKMDITKGMRLYMLTFLEHGPQEIRGLCKLLNRTNAAVISGMRLLREADEGRLVRVVGERVAPGNSAKIFDVCEELRLMSPERARKLINDSVHAGALRRSAKHNPTKRAKAIAADPELAEFIRINAMYTCVTTIARQLGDNEHDIHSAARILGIELGDEVKDPRAHDVEASNGFLPVGATIEHWARGTSIHIPSNIPGITRVTRHYTAE